jgi:hypothetical protein
MALAHRQPLVVLLGEERGPEPQERLAVGKMPTTLFALGELAVDPLERVRRPTLTSPEFVHGPRRHHCAQDHVLRSAPDHG